MGQREDVMASLVRGDSRDGVARRRLADEVKLAVVHAACNAGVAAALAAPMVAQGKREEARAEVLDSIREAGTAASAVVLASDLRAPANGSEPSLARLGEARQGWRARLANVERLLVDALDRTGSTGVDEALTEVRAMLDDPGGQRDTAQCVREASERCHSPGYCRENGCQL